MRVVKPNVRKSPKPPSWKGEQTVKTPQPKSKNDATTPLKPVPRGKPMQKQKKVMKEFWEDMVKQ